MAVEGNLGVARHAGPSRPQRHDPDALPLIPSHDAPDLTVVVPARDEETSIEPCLRSLLASTSVRLQIIAVDDRSTDRTGQLMETIEAFLRSMLLALARKGVVWRGTLYPLDDLRRSACDSGRLTTED